MPSKRAAAPKDNCVLLSKRRTNLDDRKNTLQAITYGGTDTENGVDSSYNFELGQLVWLKSSYSPVWRRGSILSATPKLLSSPRDPSQPLRRHWRVEYIFNGNRISEWLSPANHELQPEH